MQSANAVRGRLIGQVAIIFGAGQCAGEGLGNGRATALLFAREGAHVVAVDRDLASAEETVRQIEDDGGAGTAIRADVIVESEIETAIAQTRQAHGRVDVVHYNVGLSLGAGDAPPTEITEQAFDRIVAINLRGAVMACKHVLPIMRDQGAGAIVLISSAAAIEDYPTVAYKATKAAMIAYTQQIALQNAPYGIRANVILPGLIDTPMAVETRMRAWSESRAEVVAKRDAKVPLRGRMGTAWDVAHAALFLVSEEARFITGVTLPVDGGRTLKVG